MALNPGNFEQQEVDKFDQTNSHWWDTDGPLKTLHKMNPIRMRFIRDTIDLTDKTVCDVGCGGGILTESLALYAKHVSGIDLNQSAIQTATEHSRITGLMNIQYQQIDCESFASQNPDHFDVVTCMELLEHVPKPESLVEACSKLLKPGGMVFFSTLNRTAACYLKAVLMAEHVMKILPVGTHDYAKFIKPSELVDMCRQFNLTLHAISGLTYIPLVDRVHLSTNMSTNYILAAIKSG